MLYLWLMQMQAGRVASLRSLWPPLRLRYSGPESTVWTHVDSDDLSRGREALMPKSMYLVYWGKGLVDLVRFELTTSSMPWKRAPNCATGPIAGEQTRRFRVRVSQYSTGDPFR